MKYCSKCGKELMDDAIFCTACGCACDPNMNSPYNGGQKEEDKVSVGFCVLAFFIPLFGVIFKIFVQKHGSSYLHLQVFVL